MATKFGNMTLHGDLEGYARQLIDRIAGDTARRLEDAAERVQRDARQRWPVSPRDKPLHSVDRFDHGLRVDRDHRGEYIGGYVRNLADYAYFIRSRQVTGGGPRKHAWNTLVRRPANELGKQLAVELLDDVKRAAGG